MKKFIKAFVGLASVVTLGLGASFAPTQVQAQEDSLTVYMPSPAGLAEDIVAAFQEEAGIQVDLFQGTTGEILARLEAEEANPIADVVILASWTDGLTMKNDDKIASYTPAAVDSIVDGWIDEDHTLFGYSASALGVIYNTEFYQDLEADWADFAGEDFTDNIAAPDPQKSGSFKDFVSAYAENFGLEDFDAWAANGLIIPGANRAALESVTVGEVGLLIGGVDYNAYSSIEAGEPLEIYYPASGTVVNPRPAMIMKSAPNPAVAEQFIDFLFTEQVQQMVAGVYLLPGNVDLEVTNRASLDEIPQIETNWEAMMDHADDDAAHIMEITQ